MRIFLKPICGLIWSQCCNFFSVPSILMFLPPMVSVQGVAKEIARRCMGGRINLV